MKTGFTLLEVVGVVSLMFLSVLLTSPLFMALVSEVPHTRTAIETDRLLLRMYEALQDDVDRAIDLPAAWAGLSASESLLLIELREGIACYRTGEDVVSRTMFDRTGRALPGRQRIWRVRHAQVSWQVLRSGGEPGAVEVHTRLEREVSGNVERKLDRTRLLVLHALPDLPGEQP